MKRLLPVAFGLLGLACAGSRAPRSADPIDLLQALIRINTYNNPARGFPGNERAACRWAASLFAGTPVTSRLYDSAPGRANLLLRYPGDGSKQPVLFMAHIDTVDVQPENWQSDPLAATTMDDGYLYGRGAIDDKGMAACLLAAMMRLAQERPALSRDVLVLLTADEEAGGDAGIKYMVENHLDDIRAEYALNEGGHTIMDEEGRVTAVEIQCAEKVMQNVYVIATGTSGHASVPTDDNPVNKLAEALVRIAAYRDPPMLNDVTRGYFRGTAQITQDANLRAALEALGRAQGDPSSDSADAVARSTPFHNAMLRNTATATIVQAGIRFNVIPSEAAATINVRLLPGQDLEEFLARLQQAVGRDDVRFEPEDAPDVREAEPGPSPVDSDMVHAIERAVRATWPEAAVMPYMSTGATDSRDLRLAGIPSYGLLPMPLTEEDLKRMHADNERVPVESMRVGADFQYRVLLEIAR